MSAPVFMFDGKDPEMTLAYEAARHSFKFFWRELSWERRRIVPGLDLALIKIPFTDGPRTDGNPDFEHMWVDEVGFDGDTLVGQLINAPNWLTSIKQGDAVCVPFSHLTDWMMTVDGTAYGAYTVNLMRLGMAPAERRAHDDAWGLDFGDPREVRTEIIRKEKSKSGGISGLFARLRGTATTASEVFQDHPMCVNMLPTVEAQLTQDSSLATSTDEGGWTLLHREALAGNLGIVRLLVRHGAQVEASTPHGKNAATLARSIGWEPIASYLETMR